MDLNLVRLPRDVMRRCYEFAERSVADYRAGRKDQSLFFSTHGMQTDIDGQAISKMAECAFCIWADLDPMTAIDWSPQPDGGEDILFRGLRIDVKQTKIRSRFLLWPATKRGTFARKHFDILVLVKCDGIDFLVHRWTTKEYFARHHLVAPRDWKISEGSWYMDENNLREAKILKSIEPPPQLEAFIGPSNKIDWTQWEHAWSHWEASWQYDAQDDLSKSIEAAYSHIRARKAVGGKGWPE